MSWTKTTIEVLNNSERSYVLHVENQRTSNIAQLTDNADNHGSHLSDR